jgi:hypothetical protein
VIANQNTIATMATAGAPSLETTVCTSSSTHDALGRTAISPDGSEVTYAYNERAALETVDCKHRGSVTSTPVVATSPTWGGHAWLSTVAPAACTQKDSSRGEDSQP